MSCAIRLFNGRMIDPFEIERYDFTADDFIHPLSLLNRYTGHTKSPYSVAEHTYHLARAVPDFLTRTAVLHDFSEALMNDLPNPFKKHEDFRAYVQLEERVQRHLFRVFSEPWENMEPLKTYDRRICQDEFQQAMYTPYDIGLKPLGVTIEMWPWTKAKVQLKRLCKEVGVR